jgi:hypothetical protein
MGLDGLRDRTATTRCGTKCNVFFVVTSSAYYVTLGLTVLGICNTKAAVPLSSSEVSRGIREEEETGQAPTDVADDEPSLGVAEIERGIEDLVGEIGRLLASAPGVERESLHDYAVSLVREKLPAVEPRPAMITDVAAADGSNTTNLLGYGVLLLPVALLMMLVFAPLGAVLLAVGSGLVVVGGVTGLLARKRPR